MRHQGGPVFAQRSAQALFSMRLFIRIRTRICLLFGSLWKRGSGGKNVRLNKGPRPESSICYTWKLRLWSADEARCLVLFRPVDLFAFISQVHILRNKSYVYWPANFRKNKKNANKSKNQLKYFTR